MRSQSRIRPRKAMQPIVAALREKGIVELIFAAIIFRDENDNSNVHILTLTYYLIITYIIVELRRMSLELINYLFLCDYT